MKTKIFLLFLIIIGFFYRIYGLSQNYSFWTDENHVAIFVRAILERGKPVLENGYHTGLYQWLLYWLGTISAKIFGLNEFALRLPSVIFGVLTIWAIYLVGKEIFNKNTGLVAAILTAFLKIEILWSRQARPYQALQFFYLLGIFLVWKLIEKEKFNWKYFLGFLLTGIMASLTHGLGLVIFLTGVVFLSIFKFHQIKKFLPIPLLLIAVLTYYFRIQILAIIKSFGAINNLFYYRVFLWHNYSLLVFLAFVGFLKEFISREIKIIIILGIPLFLQLFLASFFLGQPFTRYFYIVFPFLVIFSAEGLESISQVFSKSKATALFLLTIFIVGMGNKFTLYPSKFYSLNSDMQEIPEVDWKRIYGFVRSKLKENPNLILVTNWNDLPVWYLEEGSLDYLIRKPWGKNLEKDPFSLAKMVYSLEEFEKTVKKNPCGILIIDSWDDRVPEGIREYAKINLKKELEVDRLYSVQPRLWPVEVYTWGIN